MSEAACIKKFGWPAVEEAVFEFTRTHFDLPCFCGEECQFLDDRGGCVYSWSEREKEGD